MNNRWYGWTPDRPDVRDLYYKGIAPRIKLPKQTDLRQFCSKVENQGSLGSCTAQALIGNIELLYLKNRVPYEDGSRLFVYYNERVSEGNTNEDTGAMLRTGIKVLAKYGFCPETEWPYDIKKFSEKPPKSCYIHAKKHLITSYHRLKGIREMQICLADGYPFVFGFTVYNSFESEKVAKSGIAELPTSNDTPIGGHAVMAVGYDNNTKRFLVRNSWGETWGQNGYFTMPFEYLEVAAADFWTIRSKN